MHAKRAQDLSAHVALIYSSVVGDDVWRMHTPKCEPVTVPVTGRLRSNNLSAVLARGARRARHRADAALRRQ